MKEHIWSPANFDDMKNCLVCGMNKKFSDGALCSGLSLNERVKLFKKKDKKKK